MKPKDCGAPLCALLIAFSCGASAGDSPRFAPATFTTLVVTPYAIEGLTGDAAGNLYTTGRVTRPETDPCPVWRIDASSHELVKVGEIPNVPTACNPSGITFDAFGNLYVADANMGGVVWKLVRNPDGTFMSPTTPFASGVPGTNGLAFDRDGNLWTGDGTTGQGRVWRIAPSGVVEEVFRIQPMTNPKGIGRQAATVQGGSTNPQGLVANGLAFDENGDLYVADTARGAIWHVRFHRDGTLRSRTDCDTTFDPQNTKTLCLENILVAHPLLEGSDGIALDRAGNIWSDANERNAIVVVTSDGRVIEVFRNPVNGAGLRNSADTAAGNAHILESPTSPFLLGKRFCTASSDGNRRDNSPNSAGEIASGGPVGARGKISCMDQPLPVPGLPLPVR